MKIYENGDRFGQSSHRFYTFSYPYYTRITSSDFICEKKWTDYIEIDTAFESKIFWIKDTYYYRSMGFFFCYKRNARYEWQTKRVYLGERAKVKRVLQPINCRKVCCTYTID